ncbi:MAG: response regulator [Propionicimonas sp.]
MPAIRVGLADDDSLSRMALASILGHADGIEVAWTVADGQHAVDAVRGPQSPVDVVLMDLQMPLMDGLTACRLIREQPSAPAVIMLTTFDTTANISKALAAGATGFLAKDEVAVCAADAVRAAASGAAVFSPAATRRIRERIAGDAVSVPAPGPSPLTGRETRIALLVAEALTNREVAKRLGISESTAKTHVSAIITKLGCTDRVGIVIWAFRNGLKH